MNQKTDELYVLLKKIIAEDQEAFRALYDLTHKQLHAYLMRILKDQDMAEDVVVETYTAIWQGAKTFKGRSKVRTWVFGIARNLAMNALKKIKHHNNIDDFEHLTACGDVAADSTERRDVVAKALLGLSSKHREVLDLVFYQGFIYAEIADILGTSVNTVKTRIFYAKKALFGILEQMGVSQDDI